MPSVDAGQNRIGPSADPNADERSKDQPIALRPGKPSRSQEEQNAILLRARKRMDKCISFENDLRREGLDDDKFYAGDQWPQSILQERATAPARPTHTINKLPTFVHQVTNPMRENPLEIMVSPVGDRGDPDAAKIWRGLVRAIQRDSAAEEAYDSGRTSAAVKGWGYWRVLTDFDDYDWDDPSTLFNKVIVIGRVANHFTVYIDPLSVDTVGKDAKYGFITEMKSREDFKEEFPEADPMPWVQGGFGENYKNWITEDGVRIAEYYECTNERLSLVEIGNGHVGYRNDIDPGLIQRFGIVQEREVLKPTWHWYKLTAKEILEETPWPGKWLPIVRVVADELWVEGRVKRWGIVRFAKEPQRAYNYWVSKETEAIALVPNAPWLIAEGQAEGFEDRWATANTRSHPYLQYRPLSLEGHQVPPPTRLPMGQVPMGIEQARMNAAQDMMAVTGIRFDATLQERVYDESGRALRELRRSGDIGQFHLTENYARALRHTGEIILDLAPHVYDTRRVLTIVREDDSEETVMVNPQQGEAINVDGRHPLTGRRIPFFNPKVGRYAVTVTVGPSYATKRIEASESMMDFVKAIGPVMPQAAVVISDLIAKNQDWPGSEEIATRLAKVIAMQFPGVLSGDIKDIPPALQAIMQAMDARIAQLSQERVQMLQALNERQTEFSLQKEKQDQDFEAKLLQVVQRAEANYNTHIGAQIRELAEATTALRDVLLEPPTRAAAGANGALNG